MRTVHIYPSQVRKGDLLTLSENGHTTVIPATDDAYEIPRGYFSRERRFAVPVSKCHATLWQDTLTYTASQRVAVYRST